MFGKRFDGWALRSKDSFMNMIPLIMTKRNDSEVFLNLDVECKCFENYIKQKKKEGIKISHLSIILAAYIRIVSQRPDINRFAMGTKVYVRKHLTVSFAIVKQLTADRVIETTVKLYFSPTDTIFDVAEKVENIILKGKKVQSETPTDKVASIIFKIPFLAPTLVGLIKAIDRVGLLPMFIINASPFHTSMFITNMASIRMPTVYHHIYNFGTTSVFASLGKREERVVINKNGELKNTSIIPMAFVIDERITSGAVYAKALHLWEKYLKNPELLEIPPENVFHDDRRVIKYKKEVKIEKDEEVACENTLF